VRVEWRLVDRLIACAARPCGVTAAVTKTGLMADQHFAGAECVPLGAARGWVGGWVIHFPVVVCTNSPSTTSSLVACAAYPVSSDGCRTVSLPDPVSALIRRCAVNSSVS
jgi:hypothetical protein